MKKIISLFLTIGIIFSFFNYNIFADNKISTYDYNAAKPLIETHDVISFDIFDTLLVRPYADSKDAVNHFNILKSDEKFKNELKLESDFEKIILQPQSEDVELFNYAKSKGKRVIIVSDMYINSKKIAEILNKNGINGWENLYVSCDVKKTKSSGELFDYVLNDLKVKPETILHIGDNLNSDCKMANSRGIHSFYTPKIIDRLFSKEPRTKAYYNEHKDDLTASMFLGVMAINMLNQKNDYWYNFGYFYAGPICYAYAKWLKTQFEKDDIEKALFIARDGYSIQKIFDLIKGNSKIESQYFYTPRVMYALCTPQRKNKSLNNWHSLMNYYKNKDSFLKNNTPDPNPQTVEECEKFVNDNIEIYKRLANKEKSEYNNYLDTLDLNNKKLAVIDATSWNYTSLKFLNLFLDKCCFVGYYVTQRNCVNPHNFTVKGLLDRYINPSTIEYIMSAPEPHVERIQNSKPVYDKNWPISCGQHAKIDEGIQEFAKNAEKSLNGIDIDFNKQSICDFEKIIWIPNSKEDAYIKNMLLKTENNLTIEKLFGKWFEKILQEQ